MSTDAEDGLQTSGSASSSSEAAQLRAERERCLITQITDTPGLLGCIMAFLPLRLLVHISHTWEHVAPSHTHLTISAADKAERSFWQRVPIDLVSQWARCLTQLTSIVLRQPVDVCRWCFDVFLAFVEGHVEGRQAANLQGGALQTVTIDAIQLTQRDMRTVTRTAPAIYTRPSISLPSLTAVSGLADYHFELWHPVWDMPSLEHVEFQDGHSWSGLALAGFISSSRSLRCVTVWLSALGWSEVFRDLPTAAAGQPGPLRRLESIRGIMVGHSHHDGQYLDELKASLLSRGCLLSLAHLDVRLKEGLVVDSTTLSIIHSLDTLITTCCVSPDAVTVTLPSSVTSVDLTFFYCPLLSAGPLSPFVKSTLTQLASRATEVDWVITEDNIGDDFSSPSEAAKALAADLPLVAKATSVRVRVGGTDELAVDAEPIDPPAILQHLKPDAFPQARQLTVDSRLGCRVGGVLGSKMPVRSVSVGDADGMFVDEGEVCEMLQSMGAEKQLAEVRVEAIFASSAEGLSWGERAGDMPLIENLVIDNAKLPNDTDEIGEYVYTSIESSLQLRGVKRLRVGLSDMSSEDRAAVEEVLTERQCTDGVVDGYRLNWWRRTGEAEGGLIVAAERD
ncbi:unnamed protein product [Vitrella brassicaformis CCMP3155]|uniref:Uncharacterized protein n=2 Tax=Vitrella brassicaformis TaxID=1169539 RepID=A0A0G4FYZ9_VITBC|nr:unnamed protein product [Vitrella brassicaformis CCMP3155]|eukprot:CEM20309.1 unnamed protein product [Vitrella brassicaformis CCMP3155]